MTDIYKAAQQALEALEGVDARCITSGYVGMDGQYLKVVVAAKAALRDALAEQPAEQEPVEIEMPEYHSHGMGCGLEDRGITDRYEAMEYGWYEAIDRVKEELANFGPLYTAPQPRRRLTDEEIDNTTRKQVDDLLDHIYEYGTAAEGIDYRVRAIARAIERAHGIGESHDRP